MTKNLTLLAAALTFVGVPAGLAITGGNVDPVMIGSLAVTFAGLLFATRRWPLAALVLTLLVLTLLVVAAWRSADLIATGWVWPATAMLVAVVLHGRLPAAAVAGVLALAYGTSWDWAVATHPAGHVFAHIGGEALWLGATLAGASAYRSGLLWRAEVANRIAWSADPVSPEILRMARHGPMTRLITHLG